MGIRSFEICALRKQTAHAREIEIERGLLVLNSAHPTRTILRKFADFHEEAQMEEPGEKALKVKYSLFVS